jgi:hypothetical protein
MSLLVTTLPAATLLSTRSGRLYLPPGLLQLLLLLQLLSPLATLLVSPMLCRLLGRDSTLGAAAGLGLKVRLGLGLGLRLGLADRIFFACSVSPPQLFSSSSSSAPVPVTVTGSAMDRS